MLEDQKEWEVKQSHICHVPRILIAGSLPELRSRVQAIADAKKVRRDRPPIGNLHFRYEHDDFDQVCVVHVYFDDHRGARRRFMRLGRI